MIRKDIQQLEEFLLSLGMTQEQLCRKDLLGHVSEGKQQFVLEERFPFEDDSELKATLHFHKGAESYYLSYYEAMLEFTKFPHQNVFQQFWMWEIRPTFRTAWNLLHGRSAELTAMTKTRVSQRLWMKIDFGSMFSHQEYRMLRWKAERHYSIRKVLQEYPGIMETLHPESLEQLVKSLQMGNRELVTFSQPRQRFSKMYIEANPDGGLLKLTKPEDFKIHRNHAGSRPPTGIRLNSAAPIIDLPPTNVQSDHPDPDTPLVA